MTQVTKFHSLGLGLEPQSSDPLLPKRGQLQYADGTVREEGIWRFDGTNWVALGGASSGINYIEDFENANEWDSSDIAKIIVSENTLNPQRGLKDLQILKAAAQNGLDEFASIAFTIDAADRGKVLPIKADYRTGTNVLDDDFEIVIRDVTNAVDISVNNNLIKESPVGGLSSSLSLTYFQTAIDSVEYELRIYVRRSTTDALALIFDNMFIGPQPIAVEGSASSQIPTHIYAKSTNGQSIPASVETTVIYNTVEDQLGNLSYDSSTGIATILEDGIYSINVTARTVADTISFANLFVTRAAGGTDIFDSASSDTDNAFSMQTSTQIRLFKGDTLDYRIFTAASTTLQNSGNGCFLTITRQNDLSALNSPSEVIQARYKSDLGQTVATETTVIYNVKSSDTHNSYNASTGEYSTPQSGYYSIKATARVSEGFTVGERMIMRLKVNGVEEMVDIVEAQSAGNFDFVTRINDSIFLNAGDVITITVDAGGGDSLSVAPTSNVFSIHKI